MSKTISAGRKAVRKLSHPNKKTKAAMKQAAVGAGALVAAKAAYSTVKFIVKAGLLIGATAAAVAFIPKPMRRQITDAVSDVAGKAMDQARSLTA